MRAYCLAALTLLLVITNMSTVSAAEPTISPDILEVDYSVVERSYKALHPSLNRYRTPQEVAATFAELKQAFSTPKTRTEVFLALSRFTAAFQCGHTYANFYNQGKEMKAVFARADKLPFTFALLERRLIVTHSAATNPRLAPGVEIIAIDGVPVDDILAALLPLVKGDGARPDARLYDLQVTGEGQYEPFDIFFPLLYPPKDGTYRLTVADGDDLTVEAISREARQKALTGKGVALMASPDSKWSYRLLDGDIGYLRPGSFVTWKMDLDWRGFIEEAFRTFKAADSSAVILDLRGNGGGDPEVVKALLAAVAIRPLTAPAQRETLKFETVPDSLRAFLGTWDKSFYDWSAKVSPLEDGRFLLSATSREGVAGNPEAYSGKVVMLVDRAASSATFTMAQVLKESGRAVLVGEETGGNLRGITGGAMFFLTLPGSGVEIDVPIIRYTPDGEQPDAGVTPDVYATRTLADIRGGGDSMLQAAILAASQ